MSNRRYINHNQSFTDFAYRYLLTAKDSEKASLNEFELKIFKDHGTILKFCQHSPHDKIKLIMTKMGLRWVEIWSHEGELLEFALGATADQYAFEQKRADAIQSMAERQIWATSDREFTHAYMLAQNANTDVYSLSSTTKEVTYQARHYRRCLQVNFDEEVAASKEAYDYFNKLLLAQLNSVEWAKEALNLDMYELRVLSALFNKKNSALTLQEIHQETKPKHKGLNAYVYKVMEQMEEKKLILSDATQATKKYGKKVFYIITGLGIKKMIEYRNHVQRNAFGSRG